MFDAAARRLVFEPAPALPVTDLVVGQSTEVVAELLPRLFNLCRAAQSLAVRSALGLETDTSGEAVADEIKRDHLMRFFVVWPRHFGQPPEGLPDGWRRGGGDVRRALFGSPGRLPEGIDDFRAFVASRKGVAGALSRIAALFRPAEAVADGLPFVSRDTAFDPGAAVENSVAGRQAHNPVLQAVEKAQGRGPFWRAAARAYDLEAVLDGRVSPLDHATDGAASVQATRGLYSVRARVTGGKVAEFSRVTPSDHLVAPGGILDRALATLSADRAALAPLLFDILDPCAPVRLKEEAHA